MSEVARFPYTSIPSISGKILLRPMLAIHLSADERSITTNGLLDTGADVSVLPFRLGTELGAVWENQRIIGGLSGNLANYQARGLVLDASVANFAPVRLAFAWIRAEDAPLILGQINFFAEFDVCFFQSQNMFEVRLR